MSTPTDAHNTYGYLVIYSEGASTQIGKASGKGSANARFLQKGTARFLSHVYSLSSFSRLNAVHSTSFRGRLIEMDCDLPNRPIE